MKEKKKKNKKNKKIEPLQLPGLKIDLEVEEMAVESDGHHTYLGHLPGFKFPVIVVW